MAAKAALLPLLATVTFAQSAGSIAGVVIDLSGAGISDASVILHRSTLPGSGKSHNAEAFASTRTGPNGAFRVNRLPPGEYDIEIGSPGLISFSQHQTAVEEGKTANLGRVVLGVGNSCTTSAPYQPPSIQLRESPGNRIVGSVYETDNFSIRGLSGVSIILEEPRNPRNTLRTKTDSEGDFVFTSVLPGAYSLRASQTGRAGFTIDELRVEAGKETTIETFPLEKCPLLGLCRTRSRFRAFRLCE